MEDIKVCPFCGREPVLTHNIKIATDREFVPLHDFEVSWEIKCLNCGTHKKSCGFTYYRLCKDGSFEIANQNFSEKAKPSDKRKEVIEMWNKRF